MIEHTYFKLKKIKFTLGLILTIPIVLYNILLFINSREFVFPRVKRCPTQWLLVKPNMIFFSMKNGYNKSRR